MATPFWDDTIVASATAPGMAAIAMVRMSGSLSLTIADRLLVTKKITNKASHTLHFGLLKEDDGSLIDEVVVAIYKAPHSYTGENIVEITCHGSVFIQQQIIELCIKNGARLALPGEFTQRAFLNGKLDLAQAEAVADVIAAESEASHKLAISQMRGGVSNELAILRDQLIHFTALVELELDFSDEDVEFADRTQLKDLIQNLKFNIQNLITSFEYGNAIKNGVPVAIIGKPNAGKSTLLNALLKEERAIVSNIPGTTRDIIEEAITIEGIRFRFIDTAGIRETNDVIEAIGVEKAKEKVKQAQVVIHLYEDDCTLLEELADDLSEKIVFNLLSKVDVNGKDALSVQEKYPQYHHFGISVKTGFNLSLLNEKLVAPFLQKSIHASVVISNARHKESLVQTAIALSDVEKGMDNGLSGDLLSYHLKDALYHLGSITGKIDVDKDILGAIFSRFCIGK